jgi:ketosteroid isomerase-like protein
MLFLLLAPTSVFCQTTTSSSEGQIRSTRQEIDEAFQRHDAKQLTTFVSSDCHFTAASVHIDGSDALERFHASLFAKRSDVILNHHPNRIAVNEAWGVASEQGDWIERWTNKDGVTELRGTYLTIWKREGGHWREYSETIGSLNGSLSAIGAGAPAGEQGRPGGRGNGAKSDIDLSETGPAGIEPTTPGFGVPSPSGTPEYDVHDG